jgi:hypothetical protein
MNYGKLTEKKANDRLAMAREVADLCRTVARMRVLPEIIMDDGGNRKRVAVRISGPGGLTVRVHFAGDTPQPVPDTYVLSWYLDSRPDEKWQISPMFAHSINAYHRRKATDICYGFPELMTTLRTRLEWMEEGRAVCQQVD